VPRFGVNRNLDSVKMNGSRRTLRAETVDPSKHVISASFAGVCGCFATLESNRRSAIDMCPALEDRQAPVLGKHPIRDQMPPQNGNNSWQSWAQFAEDSLL
jgi:hypothetical protein